MPAIHFHLKHGLVLIRYGSYIKKGEKIISIISFSPSSFRQMELH